MNPEKSSKWLDSDEDENPGYPISPNITVVNEFNNQDKHNDKEFITLIHEGNGTFTLPSGNLPQNNPGQQTKKGVEDKEVKDKEVQDKDTGDETFISIEGTRVLSKPEMGGDVHGRLCKETLPGKNIFVIITSTTTNKLFSNPSTTRKILDNSIFKRYMVGPIEVKGKGKSVKLEVKDIIDTEVGLKNIEQLANYPVSVWSPSTRHSGIL